MDYALGNTTFGAVGEDYKRRSDGLFEPWLIGICFDWMFMGILMFQLCYYYTYLTKDPKWIKILVGTVSVFSCLKTGVDFMIVWTKNIQHFGDYEYAAKTSLFISIEPSLSQLTSSLAQSFFVYRCFRLTNRNYFVLCSLCLTMAAAFALSVALSVNLYLYPPFLVGIDEFVVRVRMFAVPSLTLTVVIDLFITLTVTYQLCKSRKGFHDDTDTMVSKIVRLTWESALPPALSAILNEIIFLAIERNAIHMLFSMLTPRLYAFSLMHTLNSRPSIRNGSDPADSTDFVSTIRYGDASRRLTEGDILGTIVRTKGGVPKPHGDNYLVELPVSSTGERYSHFLHAKVQP